MAFSLAGLGAYTDQIKNRDKILFDLQLKAETAALAQLQTGIKTAETINMGVIAATMQDGAGCGFNAAGSATLTQRTLTVKKIKFQDSYCPDDLEAKWTQVLLKEGSQYSEKDLPKWIMDEVALLIKAKLEKADWQGDTASGDADLNKYDGLAKIINAEGSVITATASTYNETNCRTIIRDIISKIPDTLKGNPNVVIYMGYDKFDTYVNKLAIDNLYHYSGEQAAGAYGKMRAENSLYTIKALPGLNGLTGSGVGSIFALDMSRNAFLGMDMKNEEEKSRLWYDVNTELIKYSIRFKRGWQIGKPAEIVKYADA